MHECRPDDMEARELREKLDYPSERLGSRLKAVSSIRRTKIPLCCQGPRLCVPGGNRNKKWGSRSQDHLITLAKGTREGRERESRSMGAKNFCPVKRKREGKGARIKMGVGVPLSPLSDLGLGGRGRVNRHRCRCLRFAQRNTV